MFTNQINEFIDRHNLPLSLTSETPSSENSFYHAIFQLIMLNKSQLQGSLDMKFSDLTPRSLKSSLIEYRKAKGTEDVVCENCRNLCKNGLEHLDYLSKVKVPADDIIFQTIPTFLKVSLYLIYPDFRPQYFSCNDGSRLVFYMFNIPGQHSQALMPSAPNSILHIILSNFDPMKSVKSISVKHVSFLCSSCKYAIKQTDTIKTCHSCRKEFHVEDCLINHGCEPLKIKQDCDTQFRPDEHNRTSNHVSNPDTVFEKRKIKNSVLEQIWKTQRSAVIFKNFFVNCITNQSFRLNSIPTIKQVDYFLKSPRK